MRPKPLIAVPADRRMVGIHPFHMVGEKYLKAVTDAADALPVVLPVMAEELVLEDTLEYFDGLLLTGSPSDIEPHHYGAESVDPDAMRDPERDALTLPLASLAIARGMPLLAICRGFQELNVALGGTLHQKVHDNGFEYHKENPEDSIDVQYGPSHPVNLVEGGLLHQLADSDKVMVNSLHGQGIKKLADGVSVEAISDDGLVEAYRVDEAPRFALAVQWHPEWRPLENPFYHGVFKAFGDACRERMKTGDL